jgi:rare lipoprotein A (peptidoglycan hydrolase)
MIRQSLTEMMGGALILAVTAACLITTCNRVVRHPSLVGADGVRPDNPPQSETRNPKQVITGPVITGKVCWYGWAFHGRPTASGELYDTAGLTAASTLWPIGTRIRVTSRRTGRSTTVRVNDRGPYCVDSLGQLKLDSAGHYIPDSTRLLDLSQASFAAIDDTGRGVITVDLEIVSYPVNK